MNENDNIESTAVTTRSTGIRYGLILAVISIALFLVMAIAKIHPDDGLKYVGWVVTIAIIFLAHKYYKENGDGFMTIGQGIGISFWIGLISSVVASVFQYVYTKFFDANFITFLRERAIQEMTEKLEKQGSTEAIEMGASFIEKFTNPEILLGIGLVAGIIVCVIVGIIVSLITKKTNPEFTV